jgi:hypothetical protein
MMWGAAGASRSCITIEAPDAKAAEPFAVKR